MTPDDILYRVFQGLAQRGELDVIVGFLNEMLQFKLRQAQKLLLDVVTNREEVAALAAWQGRAKGVDDVLKAFVALGTKQPLPVPPENPLE